MKQIVGALSLGVALLASVSTAQAGTQIAGPKGGKLLENEAPRAEFFVEKDHTVTITFYDEKLAPVAASDQIVTATAEAQSGKVKLDFAKKGDVLVSNAPLPEGHGYNVVVQVRKNAAAKPQNFRIKFDTHECAGCKLPEYACTCDE